MERILSSPTVRCRQTVEPLARDRLLQIEPVVALGVDAGLARMEALLWDQGLANAVLCTHGEMIGQLFAQLTMDEPEVTEPLDWPKGSTWLLQRTEHHVRARHLPPWRSPRRPRLSRSGDARPAARCHLGSSPDTVGGRDEQACSRS